VDNFVPKDLRFSRLVTRIKTMVKTLQSVNFFHVLWENNKVTDLKANNVVLLPAGTLLRDKDEKWDPTP